MCSKLALLAALTLSLGLTTAFSAQDVVDTASGNPNFSTLVTAVQAAGLVDTLKGPGPFTVFAPTNDAFGKLPAGTVDTLIKPESKDTLSKILTYHVVAGKVTAADVMKLIKAGGGKASIKTVEGGTITAMARGGKVMLMDEKGGSATVLQTDLMTSNGVIHVIDTVLMPQ